jgi:hypothetical protein
MQTTNFLLMHKGWEITYSLFGLYIYIYISMIGEEKMEEASVMEDC